MSRVVLFVDSVHPICEQLLREAGFECSMFFQNTEEATLQAMEQADALVIRSRFKLTADIIQQCKKLRCIARAGAGMENIDLIAARQNGVVCIHAPEGNKDAVAEHALGMLLMLMNNLGRANREVREGIWRREENRGTELKGKTIGIIGYGNMGSAFAERLIGFGVKILVYDKYKSNFGNSVVLESNMEDLFSECDVVSVHVPLTAETEYFINKQWLKNFHKSIVLINTARGKCVNTADLAEAMRAGKVTGACLDVIEYESVSFEKINPEQLPMELSYLFQQERVILSPHIAGWTHESNEKIGRILAERIIKVFH